MQKGRRQQRLKLGVQLFDARAVDQIDLGDDDGALAHAQQLQDLQMLDGLRHHPIVCGDHQHRKADAAGAGEHGLNEPLVPWHIDKAEAGAVRHCRIDGLVGVAELDGDAARLFFFQAVGFDPGQGPHQRRLAMVDVTCGADDHASAANTVVSSVCANGDQSASWAENAASFSSARKSSHTAPS